MDVLGRSGGGDKDDDDDDGDYDNIDNATHQPKQSFDGVAQRAPAALPAHVTKPPDVLSPLPNAASGRAARKPAASLSYQPSPSHPDKNRADRRSAPAAVSGGGGGGGCVIE